MDEADRMPGEGAPAEVDLRELPVGPLLEQIASELAMVAAAHLGLLPGTEGGGDPASARRALDAGDAIVGVLLDDQPPSPAAGGLRRTFADLKLAYAQLVEGTDGGAAVAGSETPSPATQPPPSAPPAPAREQAPRPRIWTPGGEV
jgi:hypothetical protein